jgi:predicted secreted protein
MASYTGQDGVLKLDGTAVAELRSFSIETTTETIEDTTMTDSSRTYRKGLEAFSGTADVFFDDTHHDDIAALNGGTTAVTLEAYPGGITAGYPRLFGNVIVTGYSITAALDGMVEASISFQGTGDLNFTGTSTG